MPRQRVPRKRRAQAVQPAARCLRPRALLNLDDVPVQTDVPNGNLQLPVQPQQINIAAITVEITTAVLIQQHRDNFQSEQQLQQQILPIVSTGNANTDISFFSNASELGYNVANNIKIKIINNEYIDLGVLVSKPRDPDNDSKSISIKNGNLIISPRSRPTRINDVQHWTDAFLIFASIYTSAYPHSITGILKYIHTIRLGASRSSGDDLVSKLVNDYQQLQVEPVMELSQFQDLVKRAETPIRPHVLENLIRFYPNQSDAKLLVDVRIPSDKLCRLKDMLNELIMKNKTTLKDLQSLVGLLNFCTRALPPARAFNRRFYDAMSGLSKPFHRIRINKDMKEDINVWLMFLDLYNGILCYDVSQWLSDYDLHLFTDSAGNAQLGCAAVLETHTDCASSTIRTYISAIGNRCKIIGKLVQINSLEIFIPHSKTDQSGRGSVLLIPATYLPKWAVKAVKSFMNIRPPYFGTFFCHLSGQPVTRYQFNCVLRKCLNFAQIDSKLYKSHTVRIGAATTCSILEVDENKIAELGLWKSNSYKSYIRVPIRVSDLPNSIWIIGSSIISIAFVRAKQSSFRKDLELDGLNASVLWQGKPGMKWGDLKIHVKHLLTMIDPPNFLVLHCSGKDIGSFEKSIELMHRICFTIKVLSHMLPNTKLIWSQILPRLKWRNERNHKVVNKS
ncbi:hypothetical protein KUTeg_024654 [Tegillarca granosa]|uniref:Uncharacterized protein n=1 Tax=Tegillarca granosa TaxID=220873 RepID=A0ABQ9E482_TEGGR|nr:hypothetical protein KUTeg_024654 [Tegillarca granosa]